MLDNKAPRSSFRLGVRFWAVGMTVALVEEFISQGVLRHTVLGWIIPTLLAFTPFLIASAFAPIIMRDKRTVVVGLVKWFKRFLSIGFVSIYFVTFVSGRQSQFAAGIISIIIVFLALNAFYFRYIRSWRHPGS